MTQETRRRALSRALKYIAGLALVALAAGLAYWCVAAVEARMPRFDEAAWSDANAVLTDAVGKAAVERGVFFIPKAKIPFAQRSLCATGLAHAGAISCYEPGDSFESITVFLDGPRSFIIRKSKTCPFVDPVAPLTEAKARHIIAVLRYLGRIESPSIRGGASYNEQCLQRRFQVEDVPSVKTNPRGASDGTTAYAISIAGQLRGHLALSYLEGLFRRGDVWITENSADIRALGKALVEHAVPPHNMCEALLANEGIGFLTTYPDPSALRLLDRALRIAAASQSGAWWKRLPLINQFYVDSEYTGYLYPADAAIWAAKTLGGGPEGDRAQIAFDARETPGNRNFGPTIYLATAKPAEYARLLAARYPSYDAKKRVDTLSNYYRNWGSDVAVARAGVEDTDVQARYLANWQIFKATHELKRLSACLDCLGALRQVAGIYSYALQRYYRLPAQAYFDDPTLAEIPSAFLSAVNDVGDEDALVNYVQGTQGAAERAFAVLALAGGKENVDAAMKIMSAYETAELATPQLGRFNFSRFPSTYDFTTGCAVTYGIGNAKDPQVADRVIEFLAARSPKLSSGICEALIAGLAESGDKRLVGILNAALEGERQNPSGRKCVDRDKGRPFGFVDLLRRSLMTVELRNAADPVAYLADSGAGDMDLLQEVTARFLGERYTLPDLQALLADDRSAGVRSAICLALMAQREKRDYPDR